MPERLAGDALHPVIFEVADAESVPRVALLALSEAEGERKSDAERWAAIQDGRTVNYTDEAKQALALDDRGWLQAIVNRIRALGSHDVSFGVTQQTWRYSAEYDGTYAVESILAMRAKYFDARYALTIAARNLREKLARPDVNGDVLTALYRYNRPNSAPPLANQRNYQRALAWATKWIEQHPQEDRSMDGFSGGFATLAEQMLAAGQDPGTPLTPEYDDAGGVTRQVTTTGEFLYKSGGQPGFLAFAAVGS